MEVILLERIEKLGQMGDVVKVKPGFARNFLLPQNKALRATDANKAQFEGRRSQLEAENLDRRKDAERVASDLDGMSVILVRQASDSDQLYGSVTTRDIAAAVSEAGVTIDRNQVQLDKPIKLVGMHDVRVNLHPEVSVTIVVNVARSQDEAEMQARGERINRDGDIVDIVDEDAMMEQVFEEGGAPQESEDEPAGDGAPAEDGDADRDDPEKTGA